MKNEPVHIVIFGHNTSLLEMRQWVLQSRGYRVHTIETLAAMDGIARTKPVRLLLLCGSLAPAEREGAIALAGMRWPGCAHLALKTEVGRAPTGLLGQLLHTMEGPATLIAMVGEAMQANEQRAAEHIPQARAS